MVSTLQRTKALAEAALEYHLPSFWGERHFYIPETGKPIVLQPHQKGVVDFAFKRDRNGRLPFDTILYSCPKKGGKSTITGMVGRWASEEWGKFGEVSYVGNDLSQAMGRGFARHKESIELDPRYQRSKGLLPDEWLIHNTEMKHLPSGTMVKAIATDYQGEAGANPIITFWEELWGFIHKDALRFWAEVSPSPTRPDSVRMIATYAGYEGESELLWGLYDTAVKQGRQLTSQEIAGFPEGPVPCYVNGRIFAYWDSGEIARRMPWQQGDKGRDYYNSEAGTQTPQQFRRLHLNEWVSSESEFVPIILWDACNKGALPMTPDLPMVMALDAAVTGDCFGLVIVSRDPQKPEDSVRVRYIRKWTPPKGGAIDFREVEAVVRDVCANYNIVEVCYDPYQLHDFSTRLLSEGVGNFHEFLQGQDRMEADSMLYQLICHKRIGHSGEPELREHIQNANAKTQKDEDSKLRIVKKAESRKIDLAVCLSMAAYEALRLNIG